MLSGFCFVTVGMWRWCVKTTISHSWFLRVTCRLRGFFCRTTQLQSALRHRSASCYLPTRFPRDSAVSNGFTATYVITG